MTDEKNIPKGGRKAGRRRLKNQGRLLRTILDRQFDLRAAARELKLLPSTVRDWMRDPRFKANLDATLEIQRTSLEQIRLFKAAGVSALPPPQPAGKEPPPDGQPGDTQPPRPASAKGRPSADASAGPAQPEPHPLTREEFDALKLRTQNK